MSSRRKFLRYHLLPLAAYGALALLVLYPAILHPTTLIPGGGDAPRHVWGLWWFKHALIDLGRSPLITDLIYFPLTDVEVVWETPYNEVLMLPGLFVLPPVLHYGLLVLVTYILSGYLTYLLLTVLTHKRALAFAGGLLFAFSSYRAVRALGHLSLLTTQWIPFLFLAGLLLWRRPSARRGLVLGVAAALVTASSPYYTGMVIGPALLVAAPVALLVGRAGLRRAALWRGMALAALVGGLGSLLTLAPFLRMAPETAAVYRSVAAEQSIEALSADLLSWVMPPALHPVWGRWTDPIYRSLSTPNAVETTLFPGLLTLLLAAASFFMLRRLPRSTLYWQGIALVALLMSFGPVLHFRGQALFAHMPYEYFLLLPGAYHLRAPSRFGVTALLALIVLAAFVADVLLRRLRPRLGNALLAVGTAVIVFNMLYALPFPSTDLTAPGYVDAVRDAPGRGALLSLPAGEFSFPDRSLDYYPAVSRAMYYQTEHGKPLVSGYLGRRPARLYAPERTLPFVRSFFSQDPLQPVVAFPPLDLLPAGQWPTEVQAGATLLRDRAIEHVALHCASYGPRLCRRASVLLNEALGLPEPAGQPGERSYYYSVGNPAAGAVPAALQRAPVTGTRNLGPVRAAEFARVQPLALPATLTVTVPITGLWRIQGELHNGTAALRLDGAPVVPQTLAAPGASGVELFSVEASLAPGDHTLTFAGPALPALPAGAECSGFCLGNFGVALLQPQVDAQAVPRVTYVNAAGDSFTLLDAALYAVREQGANDAARYWLATWWASSAAEFAQRPAAQRPTLALDVTGAQRETVAQAFHPLGERAGWAAPSPSGGTAFVDFVEVPAAALAAQARPGLRLALWAPDDGGFFWSADPAQADANQVHTLAPGALAVHNTALAPSADSPARPLARLEHWRDPRRFTLLDARLRVRENAPPELVTVWDTEGYAQGVLPPYASDPLVLFVHLADAAGNIVAQADHTLGDSAFAALDGQRLFDTVALPTDVLARPGLELRIGLWNPANGEQFSPAPLGATDGLGRLLLGPLDTLPNAANSP